MPKKTTKLLNIAKELRVRAKEILARAEVFHDAEAREMMRKIAEGYESLAARLEMEAGGEDVA